MFQDVFMGLIKPVLFGFIIATIGCFYGMNARGGTQGVGRATTQAVVAASVLILVFDLIRHSIPDGHALLSINSMSAPTLPLDSAALPTKDEFRTGHRV